MRVGDAPCAGVYIQQGRKEGVEHVYMPVLRLGVCAISGMYVCYLLEY